MAKKKEKRRSLVDKIKALDTEVHPQGKMVGQLFQAVAAGELEEVKELCEKGVDLNALVDLKTTIHVSLAFGYEGYLDCLKVLLEAGAPVMASYLKKHPLHEKPVIFTDYENSALKLAAHLGNLEAIELMLRYVKKRGLMGEENHVMALHSALLQAIENKHEKIVVTLLKEYNYSKVYTDKTLLTKACECGATDITKVILKSFPRRLINYLPHDIESETELTALESACKGNHTGCLQLLLKSDNVALLSHEYPNYTKESFDHDTTLRPLTIALKYNSLDCAEKLLEFVQKDSIKFNIPIAAHDAVKYGHFDIYKKLLALASRLEYTDENQNCSTDLNQNDMTFKSKNLNEIKSEQIIKPPAVTKVNGLNHVEMTPAQKESVNVGLVAAAHYNRVDILKYLLSLGGDVNFVAEMEITQLYDEPGQDNIFHDLTGHRKEKISALMAASAGGNMECTRVLLQHRADINLQSPAIQHRTGSKTVFPGGYTALMMAAYYGKPEILKLLLKKGADVNARSRLGWTAMSLAMHEAQAACIIPLLENGAEPKFGNFRGVETLNKRWQQIYIAAGFRLPRHSSTPHPDTCTPPLTALCKYFVRRHLQLSAKRREMHPRKNLFHSVGSLRDLTPRMRNFLLNDIDLSAELSGRGSGGAGGTGGGEGADDVFTEDVEDGEFRIIYYADYDQQTFKFWD